MDSLTFLGGPFDGQDVSANDLMNLGAVIVMPSVGDDGPSAYHIDRDGTAKHAAGHLVLDDERRLYPMLYVDASALDKMQIKDLA